MFLFDNDPIDHAHKLLDDVVDLENIFPKFDSIEIQERACELADLETSYDPDTWIGMVKSFAFSAMNR